MRAERALRIRRMRIRTQQPELLSDDFGNGLADVEDKALFHRHAALYKYHDFRVGVVDENEPVIRSLRYGLLEEIAGRTDARIFYRVLEKLLLILAFFILQHINRLFIVGLF